MNKMAVTVTVVCTYYADNSYENNSLDVIKANRSRISNGIQSYWTHKPRSHPTVNHNNRRHEIIKKKCGWQTTN